MPEELLFAVADGVASITLNRPEKLNAVTASMERDLAQAIDRCNSDASVRCVILTGAGERAFCAGSDIRALDAYATPWELRNRSDYCNALRSLRKPSIAAVNGFALGGGLEAALACDIRIAADSAQFAAPEIKLGWIGGGGMVASLIHAVGSSNAAWLVLTGDPITAEQALRFGLVSQVLPGAQLLPEARRLAAIVASRAPIAAETAKLNLKAAVSMPFEEAVAYERDLQTICFATEDAAEGRAAFKEKRPPRFRGR